VAVENAVTEIGRMRNSPCHFHESDVANQLAAGVEYAEIVKRVFFTPLFKTGQDFPEIGAAEILQ
jgi:hypothetical protein